MTHSAASGRHPRSATSLPLQRSAYTSGRDSELAELRRRAWYDDLTGLPNRLMISEWLEQLLGQRGGSGDGGSGDGTVASGTHLAVLYCDIDRFKVVNDSLGHAAGDVLLQVVAQRISDSVISDEQCSALVARVAGDEFVVVCDRLPDAAAATDVAQRIHRALADPVQLGDDRISIRASIGIALATDDVSCAEDLLQHADDAKSRAKSQGRDRIESFDRNMQERSHNRLRTELDLASAVERGELRLHYQPILHVGEGRVTGVEALVRWQHPERGLVPPGEFIPLAEETGLINQIGAWVMEQAALTGREWERAGLDTKVGVNVSARQISQAGFVDSVAALLERLGPDKVPLHLEITESALMIDPEASAHTLQQLRDLGVRLSLDDFGTGYSSLAYLQRFPVDILKIDRAFVTGIDHDARKRALFTAIVQLGHALDLLVLGEGVETPGERQVLTDMGCDLLQGFLIARPVPEEDLPMPTFLAPGVV